MFYSGQPVNECAVCSPPRRPRDVPPRRLGRRVGGRAAAGAHQVRTRAIRRAAHTTPPPPPAPSTTTRLPARYIPRPLHPLEGEGRRDDDATRSGGAATHTRRPPPPSLATTTAAAHPPSLPRHHASRALPCARLPPAPHASRETLPPAPRAPAAARPPPPAGTARCPSRETSCGARA